MLPSEHHERLLGCKRCKSLQKQFRSLRKSHPDYWNLPVPANGNPKANLLIVGLAPGMHGANKTGKPFTGDASGKLLYQTLRELELTDLVSITNIVKCLPIKNLPTTQEIDNCSRFLQHELMTHNDRHEPVVVALGGLAHKALVKHAGAKQSDYPFAHGAVHQFDGFTLVDSYHCSRYNTQTKRLTPEMFRAAIQTAATLAYP